MASNNTKSTYQIKFVKFEKRELLPNECILLVHNESQNITAKRKLTVAHAVIAFLHIRKPEYRFQCFGEGHMAKEVAEKEPESCFPSFQSSLVLLPWYLASSSGWHQSPHMTAGANLLLQVLLLHCFTDCLLPISVTHELP